MPKKMVTMAEKECDAVLKLLKQFGDLLLDEASQPKSIPDSTYLSSLACELSKVLPLSHGGIVGGIDIIHWRWAEALRDAYYLGCITEQKNTKGTFGDYRKVREAMRDTICKAFEMGIDTAPQREMKGKINSPEDKT
jgi:hypothetical protein